MNGWHLVGSGSIGCLFALRLAEAGIPLTLLLRDDASRRAWQAAGDLQVTMPDGRVHHASPPAAVVSAPADRPRHLLVTTKAPDTLDALAPLIAGDGRGQLALLLQNGMGTGEAVRARWPALRLWHAVTTAGAWRDAPFRVHCVATGDTHAGRRDDAGDAATDAAVDALFAHGIAIRTDDIRPLLWRKLAVNAVINALTAIHGCRNGDLLERDETRAALPALAAEVEAVAAAEDIRFDAPVLALATGVIRLTAGNYSSMNRDVAAGRPTEIDYINGYVVARARAHGLAVPANAAVLAAVHTRAPRA